MRIISDFHAQSWLRQLGAIFNKTNKALLLSLGEYKKAFFGVGLTSDGKYAISSTNNEVCVWNTKTGIREKIIRESNYYPERIVLSMDNKIAFTISSNNDYVGVWDIVNGISLCTVHVSADYYHGEVNSVAISPDGNRIVSVAYDRVKIWDARTAKELFSMENESDYCNVHITADGSRIIAVTRRSITIWDIETGVRLRSITIKEQSFYNSVITPDSKRIIFACFDNIIRVLEIYSLNETVIATEYLGHITSMALDRDSRLAVCGSTKGLIKIFNLQLASVVCTLEGHNGEISALSINSDKPWLISASHDCTLKIWDIEKGAKVSTLKGHTDIVTDVSVSADGQKVVSSSRDGTLIVWNPLNL